MHEFNLKIKLEDKNFCNGCRMLRTSEVYPLSHSWCKYFEKETMYKNVIVVEGSQSLGWEYVRPSICKENEVGND